MKKSCKGRLKCELCNKCFILLPSLNAHMRTHEGEKPFQCEVCKRLFSKRGDRTLHTNQEKGKKISSDQSGNSFNREIGGKKGDASGQTRSHGKEFDSGELRAPMEPHEKDSQCPKSSGRDHFSLRSHSNDPPFMCEFCEKLFSRKDYLITHLRRCSCQNSVKCKYCEKMFLKRNELTVHIKTHTSGKQLNYKFCDNCPKSNKIFADAHETDYLQHSSKTSFSERSESKSDKRKNKICEQDFSNSSARMERKSSQNSFKNKPIERATRTNEMHTNEKPFKCRFCEISFSNEKELSIHIKSHRTEQPFRCEFCKNIFSRIEYLTVHMKTHKNPLQCRFCQRSFSNQGDLTLHIKTHEDKFFKCEVCGKAFEDSSKLTVHMRTHYSDTKLFKCELCRKSFSKKDDLTIHRRSHTDEQPFKCEYCEKIFSRTEYLIIHMRAHMCERKKTMFH